MSDREEQLKQDIMTEQRKYFDLQKMLAEKSALVDKLNKQLSDAKGVIRTLQAEHVDPKTVRKLNADLREAQQKIKTLESDKLDVEALRERLHGVIDHALHK